MNAYTVTLRPSQAMGIHPAAERGGSRLLFRWDGTAADAATARLRAAQAAEAAWACLTAARGSGGRPLAETIAGAKATARRATARNAQHLAAMRTTARWEIHQPMRDLADFPRGTPPGRTPDWRLPLDATARTIATLTGHSGTISATAGEGDGRETVVAVGEGPPKGHATVAQDTIAALALLLCERQRPDMVGHPMAQVACPAAPPSATLRALAKTRADEEMPASLALLRSLGLGILAARVEAHVARAGGQDGPG